ncbi:hypothetical protein GPL21_14120 [Bradyrhizobium pachyrhizi]|uniref:Uncharacterized protein n=1 Tax=Bradyrhizobium pachyrhizi TaxID=280333 RepID=A0A844SQB7_9BRAD|nr:hypothetical protein [Bradyrhizobium pachyrhizi]MVT66239.1 hypothetical protein [Bradyrhizobium pachyrhizi]WFU57026.1 hypothetical protein QA639_05755 [Bradyrhizobium pachyrhizi]
MGYASDRFRGVRGASQPAGARNWLRRWLEAADGDIAFKVVVVTAGMLSSVAIAFGLLSS